MRTFVRRLTFDISRHRQENARPALQMMTCTAARAWCFAVGARLDGGVRQRLSYAADASCAMSAAELP